MDIESLYSHRYTHMPETHTDYKYTQNKTIYSNILKSTVVDDKDVGFAGRLPGERGIQV